MRSGRGHQQTRYQCWRRWWLRKCKITPTGKEIVREDCLSYISLKAGSIPAKSGPEGREAPSESGPCQQSPDISHKVGCETACISLWFVECNELPLQCGRGITLLFCLQSGRHLKRFLTAFKMLRSGPSNGLF